MARPWTNDDIWIKRKTQARVNGIFQQGEEAVVGRFLAMLSRVTNREKERWQLESRDGTWQAGCLARCRVVMKEKRKVDRNTRVVEM